MPRDNWYGHKHCTNKIGQNLIELNMLQAVHMYKSKSFCGHYKSRKFMTTQNGVSVLHLGGSGSPSHLFVGLFVRGSLQNMDQ